MPFLAGTRRQSESGWRCLRNLRWIAGGVVGMLFVAYVKCALTSPVEPRYQGKTVRQWIHGVSYLQSLSTQYRIDPAYSAVRAIGTNALPWIVSELAVRDHGPLVERCIFRLKNSALALPGSPFAGFLANFWPADCRRRDAEIALMILAEPLGTNILWKLMAHPNPRVGRAAACAAGTVFLKSFGASDSRPTDIFSSALLSSNTMVRAAAPHGLLSVGGIGSNDMERLLGLLFDPAPVVRRSASETLIIWASGTAPWPRMESVLHQAVNDSDSQTRRNVAQALMQIKASHSSR